MPIIGDLDGWEVEDGDFIILHGTECHVLGLVSDDHADYTVFKVHDMENDVVIPEVKVYIGQRYEIWGE